MAPGTEAVPGTHGDVEAQLAALWDAAPKAKAKAKSLSKKPAAKGPLKRPASTVTPTRSSEAKGLPSAEGKGGPKGLTKTSKGCSSKAKAKSMPQGKKKEAAAESSREARRQAMLAAVPKKVQLLALAWL